MCAFEPIHNILTRYLQNTGLYRRIKEQEAILQWSKIVGEKISAHSQAIDCKNSVLFVEVDSSEWLHELFFLKREIINKLNREIKESVIKNIIFTITKHAHKAK